MFCPNCGEQLSDDAQFCGACGAKIGENNESAENIANVGNTENVAVNQEEPQNTADNGITAADIANKAKAVGEEALNKANAVADSATAAVKKVVPGVNKTILLIACAALLVIIVVAIIIIANLAANKPSFSFDRVPHSLYAAENDDGELVLFLDGKELKNSDDVSYSSSSVAFAYNCNAFVYGGDLYKIDGDKFTLVKEDVEDVVVSSNMNALAYACDDEVFIYKDGKETNVYTVDGSVSSLVISPNGNAVGINVREDGEYVSYVSKGSKANKFSDELEVGIISDDASIVYCGDDNELHVVKNEKADDSVRIEKTVGNIIAMSKDNKKLIYTTSGGTYYYAPGLKDDEPVRISKNGVTPIFPVGTNGLLDDFRSFLGYENYSVKKYTLKGDEFESYTVASSVSSYRLSSDGNKLLYAKSGSLYVKDTRNENSEATEVVEDLYGSSYYYANADLSKIYAFNDDDDLVFSDGKSNKTTKIDTDVDNIVVSADGVCCYVKDDTLYTTSGGSKGSKVDKMNDVTSIRLNNYSIFYVWNDDTLYVSTNGKNFTKTSVAE